MAAQPNTARKQAHKPSKGITTVAAPAATPAPAAQPAAPTPAAAPAQASPLPVAAPTPAAAPAPVAVALRGGQAVAVVHVTGKLYRTAAPHNVAWWQAITANATANAGTVQVAQVVATQQNPKGVPAAFVGYCLRRGYLAAGAAPSPAASAAQQASPQPA